MSHRCKVVLLILSLVVCSPSFAQEEGGGGFAEDSASFDFENLQFSSGEVVSFDASQSSIEVRVYLDEEGNANDKRLTLKVSDRTEITDGDAVLKVDALKAGAEVDVEYDTQTNDATYIFIY